jgi:1-deoxyxylulose-5-phosphate synthase
MQYINLGRSNLKVSRLGLGAMGIGDKSWRSWVLDENEARPILKRALDLGINFIDTCDYYCNGRSTQPRPETMISIFPTGCVCRAVRAT